MMSADAPSLFHGRPPRKIALFRALQLGDLLCTVPALRALRAAAPQSHITLIGLPWASSFVKRYQHYVDDLLVFPGFPAFPEQQAHLSAMPNFLAEAQRNHFELAIQMHGSGELSNPLLVLMGAARNAGFYRPGQYCPDPDTFKPWVAREHEVLRYVRLLTYLGAPSQGEHLEFPLSVADYRALQRNFPNLPPPGSYVCIHPGARLASRRWPPERFAEVADRLASTGLKVVLTGTSEELDVVQSVRQRMRMPALNLSGRTELGAMAALIAQARLLVSNDTGVSHIAAAVATPSVIISCGADTERWAPLDQQRHRVISATMDCRPCAHEDCPTAHECAQEVTVELVAGVVAEMLDQTRSAAIGVQP